MNREAQRIIANTIDVLQAADSRQDEHHAARVRQQLRTALHAVAAFEGVSAQAVRRARELQRRDAARAVR